MKIIAFALTGSVQAAAGGNIELTADDGFDAGFLGPLIKFQGAEQTAVIGDGHGGHFELLGLAKQIAQADGSIQQAVSGMDVEMDKIRGWHRHYPKNFLLELILPLSARFGKFSLVKPQLLKKAFSGQLSDYSFMNKFIIKVRRKTFSFLSESITFLL
jgi:hypothetical protein